jgi:hypothetical protein
MQSVPRPRSRLSAVVFTALTVLASVHATGCGSAATVVATPYSGTDLEIQVTNIKVDDEKLQLQLLFVNHTSSVMQVDRNQLKLRVGGQLLTRFTGTWGGMTPAVHTISPAMSHAVHVDYIVGEGFSGPASLALSQGGVIVNGASLPLPDFTVNIERSE